MRLIDADELMKDRVENDPVRIAAECAPTAYDIDKIAEKLKNESFLNPQGYAIPLVIAYGIVKGR